MNRLDTRFAELKAAGRKALVTYLVAGDPSPDTTVPAMHALVRGGVDVIELGVPFSDPEAEGPVIQAGHERALRHGMTLRGVLAEAATFRRDDTTTPIVLMGYLNPVERVGFPVFAAAAAAAGIDALILVNLPPEEAADLRAALAPHDVAIVFLLAPTTTAARASIIAEHVAGFLYYVSLKGITGASHIDTADVASQVARLRPHSGLPLVIGFGIKLPETARALAPLADGVVIGSALVELLAATPAEAQPRVVEAWAQGFRSAIDR